MTDLHDKDVLSGLHPAVRSSMGSSRRYLTPRGARVVLAEHEGQPVYFLVNNRNDRIHANQIKGGFYELEALEQLAAHLPQGGVFCDMGANIGNHTLYMALFGGASRVIPVEPNPAAISLLLGAVLLNRIADKVALAALGYGVGDTNAAGFEVVTPKGNLGWARMAQTGGDTEVRTGDSLLADEPRIDMIKIDVESMEVAALRGLRDTLARCRPVLFVEVDHENRAEFDALAGELGYGVAQEFKPSRVNQNLLLTPEAGR